MRKNENPFRFWGGLLVVVLGSIALIITSFRMSPDQELHFTREIPSALSPERLNRNIESVSRWPEWFYSLDKATLTNPVAHSPEGIIQPGSLIQLHIDPHKGPFRKFDLTVQVTQYVPNQMMEIKIVQDSSGRLPNLFDSVFWKLEFLRTEKGSLIRGTAKAHTCHWKSRFFGKIAEKIMMNQIFYINVIKLAELRQPFSKNLNPPVVPTSGSMTE